MATQSAWEAFPPTYRKEEMKTLARWISAGESGSVVGLPGCGRSNLLGFLCHRPEVVRSYLLPEASPVALIPVNLHNLTTYDLSTLYRAILRSFYWVQDRFEPDVREIIITLYRENRASQDPFLSQSALHELLFAFQAEQTRVVLVLNHFDRFCQVATSQMLNTLRGLRDSFKDSLSLIVGMCQEVAYLPNPEALGDTYELLDSHVCWVGAMSKADAQQVIVRRTAPTLPTEAEMQAMLILTGGFPVLLRAISYWWLDTGGKLQAGEWLTVLSREHPFDFRLARLWNGLTQEEQFACTAVREWQDRIANEADKGKQSLKEARKTLIEEHSEILPRLAVKGLCCQVEAGWQIRGMLIANYIERVGPSSRGRIWIDEKTGDLYQGLTPLENLTPSEENLLRFLIKHPHKRHQMSDLLREVYSEDAVDEQGLPIGPRGRDSLYHLVLGLRKKIEVIPSEPVYLVNPQRGVYQFFPEGRPAYRPEWGGTAR